MKNSKIAKTSLATGILAIALSVFTLFGQNHVLASEPGLKEVHGRQLTELKLPVKYEKYAKKDVRIKLYTKNLITGEEIISTHNRKLDSEGKVTLQVKDLNPGTLYSFKARIKKQNDSNYSSKSEGRKGSTKWVGNR
jgi:hypothetical protein